MSFSPNAQVKKPTSDATVLNKPTTTAVEAPPKVASVEPITVEMTEATETGSSGSAKVDCNDKNDEAVGMSIVVDDHPTAHASSVSNGTAATPSVAVASVGAQNGGGET